MRSELVFAARQTLANRFALCRVAAKATRSFHIARTRIEDTTNDVLQRIAGSPRTPAIFGCEGTTHRRHVSSSYGVSQQLEDIG